MKKHFRGLVLGMLIGLAMPEQAMAATVYTNTIAGMTAFITNRMAADGVIGVSIAIVDDQSVVWTQGFGYADQARGIPATGDTVYRIASCSKTFTTAAALTLWDQGAFLLDEPVTNVLPDFAMLPRFSGSAPVTMRMLMNHHSGIIGDLNNNTLTYVPAAAIYSGWMMNYLRTDYPVYAPDTTYVYCNSGFIVLENAIERLSGMTLNEYAEARMFGILGMTSSSYQEDKAPIANNLSKPYMEGVEMPPEYVQCFGTGGMYSSVPDMAQFIKMVLADGMSPGGRVLSAQAIAEMTAPQATNLPLDKALHADVNGLGWDTLQNPNLMYAGRQCAKDGASICFRSYMLIMLDQKLGVAVLQNTPGNMNYDTAVKAMQLAVLDKAGIPWPTNTFVPAESPVTNAPQARLDALQGFYQAAPGFARVVSGPGSLTFIANAHTDNPLVQSNLVPRANGYFSPADSQAVQYEFTNTAGYDLVVEHGIDNTHEKITFRGQKFTPAPITAAWSNRVGRAYVKCDLHPRDYLWAVDGANMFFSFSAKDGVLMFNSEVLEPAGDGLAFINRLENRSGSSVQAILTNGVEQIQWAGFRFQAAADFPVLSPGSGTNGTLASLGTAWYALPVVSGRIYSASATNTQGGDVLLRLVDESTEQRLAASDDHGRFLWASRTNGVCYLAVTSIAGGTYNLRFGIVAPKDYDGGGESDFAVYGKAAGDWYVRNMAGEVVFWDSLWGGFGMAGVSGDYDGDGVADQAVYDPVAGKWYVKAAAAIILWGEPWGGPGMDPVPGDYDGDGVCDLCVYSRSAGTWHIYSPARTNTIAWGVSWGGPGLDPVPGDYDGDGIAELAVYDGAAGKWYVARPNGQALAWGVSWGGPGLDPVPGDYDGDGASDFAVYDAAAGLWFIRSRSGSLITWADQWGYAGLTPVPGDYDGDGKWDLAVYSEASGQWYVRTVAGQILTWACSWGGGALQPIE